MATRDVGLLLALVVLAGCTAPDAPGTPTPPSVTTPETTPSPLELAPVGGLVAGVVFVPGAFSGHPNNTSSGQRYPAYLPAGHVETGPFLSDDATVDMYLFIADIPGDITGAPDDPRGDPAHSGWSRVQGASLDANRSRATAPAHALRVVKDMDRADALLWKACDRGLPLSGVTVEFVGHDSHRLERLIDLAGPVTVASVFDNASFAEPRAASQTLILTSDTVHVVTFRYYAATGDAAVPLIAILPKAPP